LAVVTQLNHAQASNLSTRQAQFVSVALTLLTGLAVSVGAQSLWLLAASGFVIS